MLRSCLRLSLVLGAFAAVLTMIAADVADARGRISFGSRGSRTTTAPPATTTAPAVRPIERSTTRPANSAVIVVPGSAPGQQAAPAASATRRPPGFADGLLGAGLVGLVLGAGLTGGLGSLASLLGLALQIAIIAAIGWALLGLRQGNNQAPAEVPVRSLQPPPHTRTNFGLRNAQPR